jgi:hypothetical protein
MSDHRTFSEFYYSGKFTAKADMRPSNKYEQFVPKAAVAF